MSAVVEWCKGKKTYMLAGLAVVAGVVHWLVGDVSLSQAAAEVWAGGLAAAMRAAVAKVGG